MKQSREYFIDLQKEFGTAWSDVREGYTCTLEQRQASGGLGNCSSLQQGTAGKNSGCGEGLLGLNNPRVCNYN